MESNESGIQGLLVVLNKADRCRHLFNILLEQLGLSPSSSRKDFFDAMTNLHDQSENAAKALGEISAREALKAQKRGKKTPTDGAVSVSN